MHGWSPDGKAWFSAASATGSSMYIRFRLLVAVYLRLLPIDGKGVSKVLAYIYGGQGSINTPFWVS